MFWNKKNKDEDILDSSFENLENSSQETSTNTFKEEKTTDDNIFNELSGGLDFGEDLEENQEKEKKDLNYYINLTITSSFFINILFFIVVLIGSSYVYINQNKNISNAGYLDTFCFFILGNDIKNTTPSCSSLAFLSGDYKTKKENLEKDISQKISEILVDVYSIGNFLHTKEVSFLLDYTNNKNKVLDALNDFDKMKNNFSPNDKKVIQCEVINFKSDGNIEFSCDAYSSSWDRSGIVGESGNREQRDFVEGTSVSKAASFLNFIEKNPEYNFRVVSKQRVFESESVIGIGNFARKTNFRFVLEHDDSSSNLSL